MKARSSWSSTRIVCKRWTAKKEKGGQVWSVAGWRNSMSGEP